MPVADIVAAADIAAEVVEDIAAAADIDAEAAVDIAAAGHTAAAADMGFADIAVLNKGTAVVHKADTAVPLNTWHESLVLTFLLAASCLRLLRSGSTKVQQEK